VRACLEFMISDEDIWIKTETIGRFVGYWLWEKRPGRTAGDKRAEKSYVKREVRRCFRWMLPELSELFTKARKVCSQKGG